MNKSDYRILLYVANGIFWGAVLSFFFPLFVLAFIIGGVFAVALLNWKVKK